MYSKILILNFPARTTQKVLICHLTKKFDLLFNVLRANISNNKEGHMVIELSSDSKADFNKGVSYLKDHGVKVSSAEHEIFKDEEICTHCGACTAVCPTDALHIKRPEMEVLFDKDKCTVCELCIITCPSRAMGLFAADAQKVI